MSGPSFVLPTPPNGYAGTPDADGEAQDSRFYGRDIWLDVSTAGEHQARYVTTAAGDWAIAEGREALRQSLLRRYITNPGEWKTKPGYGAGARQYVKANNTATTRADLESRLRAQSMQDPRVASVEMVTITPLNDGSPGIKIAVLITPRGRLRGDKPLAVELEVH